VTAGTPGKGCTSSTLGELVKNENSAHWGTKPEQSTLQVAAENVDFVTDFVYLGSLTSYHRGREAEILR